MFIYCFIGIKRLGIILFPWIRCQYIACYSLAFVQLCSLMERSKYVKVFCSRPQISQLTRPGFEPAVSNRTRDWSPPLIAVLLLVVWQNHFNFNSTWIHVLTFLLYSCRIIWNFFNCINPAKEKKVRKLSSSRVRWDKNTGITGRNIKRKYLQFPSNGSSAQVLCNMIVCIAMFLLISCYFFNCCVF